MKALKIVSVIIVLLAIIVIGGSFLLPKNAKVERSVMIGVADSTAYNYISDFSKFNEWSPWYEMEPSAKTNYQGKAGEIGTTYFWDGEELGKGNFRIVSVEPNKAIYQKLTFIKPFEEVADNNFLFEKVADSTKVTWVYQQENIGVLDKWMALGLDKMLGKDWERGLSKIKTNLESK